MIYLKSCQRCKGDVHFYTDTWGAYMKCLQCGQTWNSPKAEEKADLDAEFAAAANEPDLVAAEAQSDFDEETDDPFDDPTEIRRAS